MIREAKQNGDDGRAALGRTVPRRSDEELLDDYAGRLDRGEAGGSTFRAGG